MSKKISNLRMIIKISKYTAAFILWLASFLSSTYDQSGFEGPHFNIIKPLIHIKNLPHDYNTYLGFNKNELIIDVLTHIITTSSFIFLSFIMLSKIIISFKALFTSTRSRISKTTLSFIDIFISILTQFLPEKQEFHKDVWLGELDEVPNFIKKTQMILDFLWATFILQRKRFPKYLIYLSNDQQITLTRLLFTSSLLFFFQIISTLSSWLVTYNPIITGMILFASLKIFSNIYQSSKTYSLSNINRWSFFQISLLSFCCIPAFQSHNTDSQLILFGLLALHILFFQPLIKEIIALLQEWREQNNDDLSER